MDMKLVTRGEVRDDTRACKVGVEWAEGSFVSPFLLKL